MGEETGLERALTAKGWLTTEERQFLFDSVAGLGEENHVVNIGVEYGASTICFAEGNTKVQIQAIDIDMSKWLYEDIYGERVLLDETDSQDLVRVMIGHASIFNEYIDVLFVDGDHSYEGVSGDHLWLMYVKPGGLAMFHDCYDWLTLPEKNVHQVCPGVNQAVQEWVDHKSFEGWQELPHVGTMRIFERLKW